MTARYLEGLAARLNRLRDRQREIESISGSAWVAMATADVRKLKREYSRILAERERLERRLG
jgi:hypothetical protein